MPLHSKTYWTWKYCRKKQPHQKYPTYLSYSLPFHFARSHKICVSAAHFACASPVCTPHIPWVSTAVMCLSLYVVVDAIERTQTRMHKHTKSTGLMCSPYCTSYSVCRIGSKCVHMHVHIVVRSVVAACTCCYFRLGLSSCWTHPTCIRSRRWVCDVLNAFPAYSSQTCNPLQLLHKLQTLKSSYFVNSFHRSCVSFVSGTCWGVPGRIGWAQW